jgi:hypothetical protein
VLEELLGSEDVVGPLITRTPLRISVKRNKCISELHHSVDGDFLESGKHKIIDVNDFLSSVMYQKLRHISSMHFL